MQSAWCHSHTTLTNFRSPDVKNVIFGKTAIRHAPSYYVQLCQPKCQIYEKTEYFEYAPTVLKPNLFYLINFSGINNAILEGKVEDKILNEARQRHITEKMWNFGTWNCGTLQRVFLSD